MSPVISVKLEGVKEAMEMYDQKLVKQAIRSALDKTGTKVKQDIVGAVSGLYYVKPSDARREIEVKRTTAKEFSVGIWISKHRFQLYSYFHAMQDKIGVYVNISRINTTRIPHAFIQRARGGWAGVMVRKGRGRYPISGSAKSAGLPGPSIAELAGGPKVMKDIERKASKMMPEILSQEIDARLAKQGRIAY